MDSPQSQSRTINRLALYQQQLQTPASITPTTPTPSQQPTMAARDPITCHCLNTLTGTPAANLPVILTLLSAPASPSSPVTFHAVTNADGRVAKWTSATSSDSVPEILSALPSAESKTSWSVRFEVGPWYESQGVESFWPEVEVKFTVKGRGREGEEDWRHYHVPVLLGPWNYSTYRGS
ncbi:Transthyretin/hydroxyisourate hydrolase [Penicillium taxi]|uniref:Transthyretin/hydroxyisourate hydrolase n=1 Tax=Penicillium taxi TaxID=168475 RepID=UPI002545370B|nr:Transthyretin/hydroxyisourate hydrolase [Penicillium taxi]KAJ5888024.1 Transthyretin/hydroxyisourate hydrolase [Penicillium taxi]